MLVLLPILATGQVAVLQGVVSDRVSGARLEFATVGVPGTQTGTSTDAGGHYRLSLPKGDSVTVRFSFTGYEPQEYRIKLAADRNLDVRLQPSTRVLDAVEISDEKTRHTSFTHIGTDKLDYTVGPAGGVESLIKTLPDVNSNNELSSQYSVRGGSFDENLVYINGVAIFRPMLIRNGHQCRPRRLYPFLARRLRRLVWRQALVGARHHICTSTGVPCQAEPQPYGRFGYGYGQPHG